MRDDPQLREVALFDAIINNTDRKIGHLIPEATGHLYICDHGVTFHQEDKLRTVLWQWAGEELTQSEIDVLRSLNQFLQSPDSSELRDLITPQEFAALVGRVDSLILACTFPEPNPEWPHIPWPPF
jgi:uncharacterized repeat protein (TIGR03843 family)